MGVKVKQLASKKSAIAATQKPAKSKPTKKPAKAAKPKKKSGATVASKSKKAIQAEAKNQALELQLNKDADAAMKTLTEGIPDLMKRGENLHAVMEDVKKRELWRKGSNPFKSQSEFLNHFASMAHVSIRTLQGTMGAIKALPGVSAEKRKAIGPRKLAALGTAARNLRQSTGDEGANLPDEIIDAAPGRTEAEVRADLVERGLIVDAPKPEPQTINQGDEPALPENFGDLGYENYKQVPTFSREAGDEITAEVPAEHHKSAMQSVHEFFGATPETVGIDLPREGVAVEAITEARLIFAEKFPEETTEAELVLFILGQWRKSPCSFPGLEDMTNEGAFEHLGGFHPKTKKPNGKKKERK